MYQKNQHQVTMNNISKLEITELQEILVREENDLIRLAQKNEDSAYYLKLIDYLDVKTNDKERSLVLKELEYRGTKFNHAAGGVVVNKEGKILVVQNKKGSWSLPKGTVDPGEDFITAAKREIWEETGIPQDELFLANEQELGRFTRYQSAPGGGVKIDRIKTIHFFKFMTQYANELQPIDPENPEARWVAREKVSELLTQTKDKNFFESIKEKIK